MSTTDPLTRSLLPPGVVTNPVEVDAIRRRMAYARLPWHRRIVRRRPPGWGRGRFGL